MSFIERNYVKSRLGTKNSSVLLDALHAAPGARRREFFTDEIVDRVSAEIGCHCIIATKPREVAELNEFPDSENWEAVREYRKTIGDLLMESELLDKDGQLIQPFLHLSLHGMKNRPNKDVELGTYFGRSCSDKIFQWLLGHFLKWAEDLSSCQGTPKIVVNDRDDLLFGHPVIATHRLGDRDSEYRGYGSKYNTVQIELSHWLRNDNKEDLVNLFTTVAEDFCSRVDRGDF